MSTTEVEPEAISTPSLEYVRASAPVTRRQFRFLLFLTLLNTILLATFICGPVASQFARSSWQQYQTRRQIRRQQKAQDALLQQAAKYTAPAEQIVYEEHPFDAATLLKTTQSSTSTPLYKPIYFARVPWQPPIALIDPPVVAQLRASVSASNETYGTLLLHTLKKKNGEERLVWVTVRGEQQSGGTRNVFTAGDLDNPQRQVSFKTRRMLTAAIIEPDLNSAMPRLKTSSPVHLVPDMLDMESTATWKRGDDSGLDDPTFEVRGVMRFYAGQLDPADPSHFTIDYVYRGARNTIDVHLEDDDTIIFAPRGGVLANDNGKPMNWYPWAAPATRPIKK